MSVGSWCATCDLPHTSTDLEAGRCTNCGTPTRREAARIAKAMWRDAAGNFSLRRRPGETPDAYVRRVRASRK